MKNSLKERGGQILLTSCAILLPALAGLLLWNRLPERMPTHFNAQGVADGWSGKAFAVLGIPLFLLAIHLICVAATLLDPKRRNISGKLFTLVLWISPAISLLVGGLTFSHALGAPVNANFPMKLAMGALFLVLGNYLPKCRQNYTVGIKLPWTLSDEENWNRTHRLAGHLWMIGGFLLLLDAFLGGEQAWTTLFIILSLSVIPILYSGALYLRKRQVERS